eukprot:TRINITY_DN33371_c0_g1_i1.p1 TRINITY_DN33371_c0_g1~~TRINITY_DN33371_c0_g1_i1.p1  ORF type:complete len:355 (+),score=47.16 TRINITY_DN33371_c0_g1_i1:177-1241(+)
MPGMCGARPVTAPAGGKERPRRSPERQVIKSSAHKLRLREAFVAQARTYLGTPYSKSNCRPEDVGAELYLDCCGLVRRVLQDLQSDFGFVVGQGNQAYQYDTLPEERSLETMEVGDLIFYSGVYYNPASCQAHDITHVEIFTGGTSTIGSRSGMVVSEHEDFKFPGDRCVKYHSVKYHFRSIDTWLNGVCRSFCSTHSWDAKCLKMLRLYPWAKQPGWKQKLETSRTDSEPKKPPAVKQTVRRKVKKGVKRRDHKRCQLVQEASARFEGHGNCCHFVTEKRNGLGLFVPCARPVSAGKNAMFCNMHYNWNHLIADSLSLPVASIELKRLQSFAKRKKMASKQLQLPHLLRAITL